MVYTLDVVIGKLHTGRNAAEFLRRFRIVAFLVLGIALLSACSSAAADEDPTGRPAPEDPDHELADGDDGEDGEPDWTGAPLNPFDLRFGQCFNEVSWIDKEEDRRINITASIGCEQPHDKEVYFESDFPAGPGAPFPGDEQMTAWSQQLCYDAFEEFVGEEYELSIFEIDFLQPTKATFEHPVGQHRRVSCFVFSTVDDQTVGSARAIGT